MAIWAGISSFSKKVDYSKIPDINDPKFNEIKDDKEVNEYLDIAFENFGGLSASKLSDWSHEKGSPWDKTVNKNGFTWGVQISDDLIKDYFSQFILPDDENK